MKIEERLITPQMAELLLKKNFKNRKIKERWVAELVRAIRAGEWRFNGDPIRIASDGTIIDGQHRLTAIVRAGIAVRSLVITGLDREDIIHTVDIGPSRSAGDALGMGGVAQPNNVAAALRVIEAYATRQQIHVASCSIAAVRKAFELHPGIVESCRRTWASRTLLTPSLATAFHYLFSKVNPEEANEFFEFLKTGAGLPAGHPILLLRDRLSANRAAKAKLPAIEIAAIVIKAWNAYSSRVEQMRYLRWSRAAGEEFPEIVHLPPEQVEAAETIID